MVWMMLGMFLYSLFRGEKAPPNPWGSAGYEWATASPPIAHNFHHTPEIHRGPYDYHLATDEELFDGFPEGAPAPAPAKAPAKAAPEPAAKKAEPEKPAAHREEEE